MKKLFLLLAFIIPFALAAQDTLSSVQSGFARSRATWGLSNPSGKLTCNIVGHHELVINDSHTVTTFCVDVYASPFWNNQITVVNGGTMIFEEDLNEGKRNITLGALLTSPTDSIYGVMTVENHLILRQPLLVKQGGYLEISGNLDIYDDGAIIVDDGATVILSGSANSIHGLTYTRNAIEVRSGGNLTIDNKIDLYGNTTILIDGGAATFGDDIDIFGNGNLIVTNNGDLTIDGKVDLHSISATMLVDGGAATVGNGFDVWGWGDLTIENNGIVTVNGDMNVGQKPGLDYGGELNVNNGKLIVQSLPDGTGGNLHLYRGADGYVGSGGQISVLGNKNIGGNPVTGNLEIENYTWSPNGKLLVDPNGKVLVYNNVISRDFYQGANQFDAFFYDFRVTDWDDAETSGNVNVIMGGSTCDNWWGPGGTCNDHDATLPIELAFFTAQASDVGIILEWETATELNNDFFTIERSYDGLEFEAIGTVSGGGTKDDAETYSYTDMKVLPGTIYYRLKQTDFDGMSETFDPVSVNYLPVGDNVTLFPNPIDHGLLKMGIAGFSSDRPANISITDLAGRTVMMKTVDISNAAYTVVEMNVASKLNRGAYIVNINQGAHAFTKRLVKM